MTAPAPAAKEEATRRASVALAIPEIRSPLIVSRIAFVMARPGSKGIMPPTIM